MVNTVVPIAFLTTIAIGASIVMNEIHHVPTPVRSTKISVISPPEVANNWKFQDRHTGKSCLVNNSRRVSPATQEVNAEALCTDIFLYAGEVSVMQSDIEGNVSLANNHGDVLIEFGRTDDGRLISITGQPGKYTLTPSS